MQNIVNKIFFQKAAMKRRGAVLLLVKPDCKPNKEQYIINNNKYDQFTPKFALRMQELVNVKNLTTMGKNKQCQNTLYLKKKSMNKSKTLNEANEVQVFMEVATKMVNIVQDLMKLNWELFCMGE